MDLAASLALLGVLVVLAASYGVRLVRQGRARAARVEREGKSALLGKGVMEAMYWTIAPVGGALARRGVSANAVTWASLVLALAAGGALGAGHFGVGAVLALIAAAGDALDGFVARATGTSSDAGEVLDAAVDRYSELAFLAGVGVAFRGDVALLTLTMGAIAASFMVSYSTAKAEALRVLPPRGSMRRTERAVLLVTGAALTPIAAALFPSPWDRAPMVAALAVVAVFGNVSAARRLASLVRSIRAREATPPGERATPATAFASVTALPKKPVHGAAPASQVSPASHASQPPQASQVSPLRRPRAARTIRAVCAILGTVTAVADEGAPAGRRWRMLVRHQIGATAATVVDFSTMIALVHLGLTPVVGTVFGAAAGAVTNFTMSRRWIFDARSEHRGGQAARYFLVSLTSLILNAAGEHLLHDVFRVQYVLARAIVAVVVSVCWNFTLHRIFVFRRREESTR